jgi:rhomboid protease GluP
MEIATLPEVTESIQLPQFDQGVYSSLLQKAIGMLGWYVVGADGNSIFCQTPATGQSSGELVTITIDNALLTLRIRPVNEYYWTIEPGKKSAELFRLAIDSAVAEYTKAARSLHPMHREKYGALVISKSYKVTPILVYANALVFVAMILSGVSLLQPDVTSLYNWGGNLGPAVMDGQWWRLLTYMFLHGGALHLLGNTFALLYIGMFLEPLLGRFRFASAYLLTGICAGLLSMLLHDNTVSVGASGAIFGMYGVFLSVLTTSHIQKTMRKTMLRSILFFVVFNLMMGLQGNTDNAAHIGGLLSGFIVGFVYYPGMKAKEGIQHQLIAIGVLSAIVAALVAWVVMH